MLALFVLGVMVPMAARNKDASLFISTFLLRMAVDWTVRGPTYLLTTSTEEEGVTSIGVLAVLLKLGGIPEAVARREAWQTLQRELEDMQSELERVG